MEAFYTDFGLLPRWVVLKFFSNAFNLSIHHIGGTLFSQIILFGINLMAALFLLIGYRTKLFTFVCWFFCISIQNRNGFLLNSGDELLRMLLFWGMFLPLGAKFSLDRSMNQNEFKEKKMQIFPQ